MGPARAAPPRSGTRAIAVAPALTHLIRVMLGRDERERLVIHTVKESRHGDKRNTIVLISTT